MFQEGWFTFKESLDAYAGSGMFLLLYLGALGYILVKEHKTDGKLLCGYSFLIMILTMNPVSAYIISRYLIGRDVYWRVFWLLPVIPLTAYAAAQIIKQIEGRYKRALVCTLSIVVITLSGNQMLTKENFSQSTNWYKIPEEVVRVCDIITEDSDNARIIVPDSLISYIRQYDAGIKLLYGRQLGKDNVVTDHLYPVYEAMNSEAPDAVLLAQAAREGKCNYIVLDSEHQIIEGLEENGFELLGTGGIYRIYKNVNMDEI